jgi:molybdenum cofactor cytidylyltransferase
MATMAAILLAAGRSTRMGEQSKLLLTSGGEPIARRSAKTLLTAGVDPLVVVIPPESPTLRGAFKGLNALIVENHRRDEGMSTSIAAGVSKLGERDEGLAVVLGDMPLIEADTVKMLCRRFSLSSKGIALPLYKGRRGHPVIFDLAKYREELLSLEGDRGAKSILKAHSEDILEVEVDDQGVVVDIDTPEQALEFLQDGQ